MDFLMILAWLCRFNNPQLQVGIQVQPLTFEKFE